MLQRIIRLVTLTGLAVFACIFLESSTIISEDDSYTSIIPGSYAAELMDVSAQKAKFQQDYLKASSPINHKLVIEKSSSFFVKKLTDNLVPHWMDTDYDFYGTTQYPGKGKIACGYFVTTLLRDMGYPIERVKMAQAASEKMIQSLVDENNIKRFPRVKFKKFLAQTELMGEGLYIVGLDTHTGFLLVDQEETFFIHATSLKDKVIKEIASESPSLKKSKYRVVGKVTGDEDFIKRWLHQSI